MIATKAERARWFTKGVESGEKREDNFVIIWESGIWNLDRDLEFRNNLGIWNLESGSRRGRDLE